MNWKDMPPLSALRAFAAYAQTQSISAAGDALNVSHAAVSQQLRALERHMAVALLDRSGRQMALTPEGQALAYALQEGFGTIHDTVTALTEADQDRPLHITTTPSLASNWLMPRLASFRAQHPEVDMVIDPNPSRIDPKPGGVDVALRYGTGPWPGFQQEPLLKAPLIVIAAPRLFPDGPPNSPEALRDLPWLEEVGANETTAWLAKHGVAPGRGARTRLPGNLMIDGVRQGQGVAITTKLAVEGDLAAGTLLALFEEAVDVGYSIVTHPGSARPAARAFVRWLRQEAARKP